MGLSVDVVKRVLSNLPFVTKVPFVAIKFFFVIPKKTLDFRKLKTDFRVLAQTSIYAIGYAKGVIIKNYEPEIKQLYSRIGFD